MSALVRRLFWTILLLLDGGLLLMYAAGYSARYVHPRHAWGAEMVATGLPYLTLLLLAATVGVALARRWRLLAVHVVLVGLAGVRFMPSERGAGPGPDDLVLLTFNTSRGGGARADAQGRAIAALVRAEAPDLIALQESYVAYSSTGPMVRPSEPLAALIDSLDYRAIALDEGHRATHTPLPVLSRLELLEQSQTILRRNADGRATSGVVRTRFRWQGREAVLYNLHLHSFGSRKPWEDDQRDLFSAAFWRSYLRQYREAYLVRAEDTARIRAMMDRETLPLLVSGDFNSTPHNWAFHHLARGMQDVFQVAGRGWGATYHAAWPLARIDHVLASPEWQARAARVSRAAHSDHLPLVVRLRWRQ